MWGEICLLHQSHRNQVSRTDWFDMQTEESNLQENTFEKTDIDKPGRDESERPKISESTENPCLARGSHPNKPPRETKRFCKKKKDKSQPQQGNQGSRCQSTSTIRSEIITNLFDEELTDSQKSLLPKGLTFVPDRKSADVSRVLADLAEWERRMRLR